MTNDELFQKDRCKMINVTTILKHCRQYRARICRVLIVFVWSQVGSSLMAKWSKAMPMPVARILIPAEVCEKVASDMGLGGRLCHVLHRL